MIAAESVCFQYSRREPMAVYDVSLDLSPGDVVALTGPSGSGKSTLLALLGRILVPTAGSVRWGSEIQPREISWIMQSANIIGRMSALENAMLGPICKGYGWQDSKGDAIRALESLGLSEHISARARQLSGGQSQRVAIARALASRPGVLLADEPTAQLDRESASLVMDAFGSIADQGTLVVVSTHDASIAKACDRRLNLERGVLLLGEQ